MATRDSPRGSEQTNEDLRLMFRRIVVPTDLTDRARKALQLAVRLSDAGQSHIMLLHVIQTISGLGARELKPFYRTLEAKARSRMAALARGASRSRVRITAEIVHGARAEEIVRFAADRKADLIVLASHRVNPTMIGRDWGTISYKVGILAQCPVLLVK
jgi:nucleotide-binding universal stress UspA family protein